MNRIGLYLVTLMFAGPLNAYAEFIQFSNNGEIPYYVSACVEAEKQGVEVGVPFVSDTSKGTKKRNTSIKLYFYNDNLFAFDKTQEFDLSTGETKYHVQCFKQKLVYRN